MENSPTDYHQQIARALEGERIAAGEISVSTAGASVLIAVNLLGVRRAVPGRDRIVDVEKEFPQRLLRLFPRYYDFVDKVSQDEDGKKWKRVVRFKVPTRDVAQLSDGTIAVGSPGSHFDK